MGFNLKFFEWKYFAIDSNGAFRRQWFNAVRVCFDIFQLGCKQGIRTGDRDSSNLTFGAQ
jgi:hypothetical protein